ncbi:TPA: hypothetical protein JAG59_002515 [Legionella pneumophila]|uniref:hypothetical protein n=1 Tax=Legionella pneumophila TaxID=446 RepID=UPI0007707F28|nr:hypothetical protein [Legionella pneumophila]CZI38652.1 Uncharacterised protein [Legionella pneumophila]CZI80205.1 Uncharacterised protein [Legionella pneumophila]HAT2124954.1 hypothetical protein [Legionella pneumophila]HAT5920758.1 hypothetical protein [Legionella pneumophila]HAT5923574.1 hypothetical protein [Legionella pneumophila]
MPSRSLVWNLMFRAKASRRCYASPQPKRTLDIDCLLYNPYPEPTSDKSETRH